ncbi:MAG: SAM-dependent methyltransferase [Candidatus Pacebacteria bacterium]|nr:SAM-dependent methyltransferase [Candidatus Paceibacterota bacterium]
MTMKKSTDWGHVAKWYDDVIDSDNSYQKTLILPNLLRLLELKPGEALLDVGSGSGFFSKEFAKLGVKVFGIEPSLELIKIAEEKKTEISNPLFVKGRADDLGQFKDKTFDKAIFILSLQNIKEFGEAIMEAGRVLKKGGLICVVLNHPAFRIPKQSSWGWDEEQNRQYRRVDEYLGEFTQKIEMHPGDNKNIVTFSFHRPIQSYIKALKKGGFLVSRFEEWNSGRISEPGKRAEEENRIRKEIPMFLFVEGIKQ